MMPGKPGTTTSFPGWKQMRHGALAETPRAMRLPLLAGDALLRRVERETDGGESDDALCDNCGEALLPARDAPPVLNTLPKGAASFRDLRLWHKGTPNTGALPRHMLAICYSSTRSPDYERNNKRK